MIKIYPTLFFFCTQNLYIFSLISVSGFQLKTSAKNSTVLKEKFKKNLVLSFHLTLGSFRVKYVNSYFISYYVLPICIGCTSVRYTACTVLWQSLKYIGMLSFFHWMFNCEIYLLYYPDSRLAVLQELQASGCNQTKRQRNQTKQFLSRRGSPVL